MNQEITVEELVDALEVFGFKEMWTTKREVSVFLYENGARKIDTVPVRIKIIHCGKKFIVESSCPNCHGNANPGKVSYTAVDASEMVQKVILASKRGACFDCVQTGEILKLAFKPQK